MRWPPWVGRYIGWPYGTDEGETDCWQLIQQIYWQVWGIVLPDAPGGSESRHGVTLWAAEAPQWIEVALEDAQLGDILAFYHPRLGWHAGLVVMPPWMLHSEPRLNAVRERYDQDPWPQRCVGAYRHPCHAAIQHSSHRLSPPV